MPSTIKISGTIDTTNSLDTYATHDAVLGKGGQRTVADLTERNNISVDRRTIGMEVYVVATSTKYVLANDLVTWNTVATSFGDMFKSVYDINDDGVVDNAELLEGNNSAYHTNRNNHTGTQDENTINNLVADLAAKEVIANKGAANGYCDLVGGLVPLARLPFAGITYKGLWNVTTNTPALANGVGTNGWYYKVSVPDTRDLGAGNVVFSLGEWVIYNGAIWDNIADTSGAVVSVNSNIGVVQLNTDDIPEVTNYKFVTDNEKDAALGTVGTPSNSNRFVTDTDPRLLSAAGVAGGDLSGNYPNPTVVDLTITGQANGDMLYFNGTNWLKLAAGSDGTFLQMVSGIPSWGTAPVVTAKVLNSLLVTTNKTIPITKNLIRVRTAGVTITLPKASDYPTNTLLYIKDESYGVGSNPVIIALLLGTDRIEDIHTAYSMNEDGSTLILYSNGVDKYYILNAYKL